MSQDQAKEHLASGDLSGAIDVVSATVKRHPTDRDSRGLLAELLCIAGELERADKMLDALGNQDLEAAPALALWRQVLRAAIARQDFFANGRVPEFVDGPTPTMVQCLEASVLLRTGDAAGAAECLARAEAARPRVTGHCDGQAFDDLRDLDDLLAGVMEVLTTTGRYYWIPVDRLVSIEFVPPQRPRDLIWRRAQLQVRDGPEGEVFIPAIYANPMPDMTDQMRLGRITDWSGREGAPVLGIGQRMLLVGDEALPIMPLGVLEFDQRD